MLKYLTKFTLDILPSVTATIIGAYIVNHYITAKPATNAPVTAAVSTASPKATPARAKADTKAADPSSETASISESGIKAKGGSERGAFDLPASEKNEKAQAKPAEKPVDTASIPADTRRHPPTIREKAVAKSVTTPAQPPVVAPAESAATSDEHRDANDLAREAIDRLRNTNEGTPRTQEASRAPEVTRSPDAEPRVYAPTAVQPLPPPITVSTPPSETFDASPRQQPTASRGNDPRRPVPPADIPEAQQQPLDLHAEANEPPAPRPRTNVAEDMLSAAKSVFHAVLPK